MSTFIVSSFVDYGFSDQISGGYGVISMHSHRSNCKSWIKAISIPVDSAEHNRKNISLENVTPIFLLWCVCSFLEWLLFSKLNIYNISIYNPNLSSGTFALCILNILQISSDIIFKWKFVFLTSFQIWP